MGNKLYLSFYPQTLIYVLFRKFDQRVETIVLSVLSDV